MKYYELAGERACYTGAKRERSMHHSISHILLLFSSSETMQYIDIARNLCLGIDPLNGRLNRN